MVNKLSPVQGKDTPITPATQTKRRLESYDITSTADTLALAKDLANFIKENNLFHSIQGKEYVAVEGWQYAGARLGILPVVVSVEKSFGNGQEEIKYTCKVNLLNLRTAQIIGCGYALCSSKEPGKKGFQEFAIASMAQTRAIGKAYRSILAWIIKAAGYEPTPAEEMDYLPSEPKQAPQKEVKPKEEKQTPVTVLATAEQKEAILNCLIHDCFSEHDRSTIKSNIHTLSKERAQQMITNMRNHLQEYFIQA
jgi:hypothetical protein